MEPLVGTDVEFANQTTLHPLGLATVLLLGICLLLIPRKWAILPFLLVACFISSAQRLVLFGIDFTFLRILVLVGAIRMIIRHETKNLRLCHLDIAMILWMASATFIFTLQQGSFGAFVNRAGVSFDTLGMYFIFRGLIQNWKDVERVIFICIWIAIPIGLCFLLENRTGRNIFSIFGGVPEITDIRDGRLRCQGAFSHPILAGCFWSSLIPLFVVFKFTPRRKVWAATGIISACVIVVCCASSTPILGIFMAIVGWAMFFLRNSMRIVRWTVLALLILLHFAMEAPVWHLFARISAVGGSTGWHRFNLINQAIIHFDKWWLIGCGGVEARNWGIWAGDITNHYLLEGFRGGFLTLSLFIAVLAIAFGKVGRLWRAVQADRYALYLSWALGVSLFIHCMNFTAVSYFGQIYLIFFLLLAMIGSLPADPVQVPIQRQPEFANVKQQTRLGLKKNRHGGKDLYRTVRSVEHFQ